jgi:hypothetical protein
MPKASYKAIINAPFETVSELLHKKAEKPRLFVGAVRNSTILERGDGYLIREMFQPHPVPLTIREKIYVKTVPGGEAHVFEHIDNAKYTGDFHNILTRVEGHDDQCELEYAMNWTARPGTVDGIPDGTARTMVQNGVLAMKAMAETKVEVPDFVRAFFAAVDSMNPENFRPILDQNVIFRKGNDGEILGLENMIEGSKGIIAKIKKMEHNYVQVYSDKGKTISETFVHYELPNGQTYFLPFLTAFERKGDKISKVHIYGDMTPLQMGWPQTPKA